MRKFSTDNIPKGGAIGKTYATVMRLLDMNVSLHAANACYFIVLALFPALMLLLSLLHYTPLAVEGLADMLYGLLPDSLAESGEELILVTYHNTTGAVIGISIITALWSAGRGIYGIRRGLNAIYGYQENRGYFHTRAICTVYMFGFLVVLILTLALHVFGNILLRLLNSYAPRSAMLFQLLDSRFLVLLVVQTALFTAMFMALPSCRNGFWESLPGGLLASFGWLGFSKLYSIYIDNFAHLSNVYGSVYAVALSMLWLYCCMSIVFYGGALNVLLRDKKSKNVADS